jgi:hypothetical protein
MTTTVILQAAAPLAMYYSCAAVLLLQLLLTAASSSFALTATVCNDVSQALAAVAVLLRQLSCTLSCSH